MAYVDGFMAPVPSAKKAEYIAHAEKSWPMFQKYGALSMRECWGDDVPDGQITSFPMAVKLEEGEVVVFSWIEWPDKETRDRCWGSMETDPAWAEMGAMGDMPFDGKRMIYGGFAPIFSA